MNEPAKIPSRFGLHWTHWFGAAIILFILVVTLVTVFNTLGLETLQGTGVVLEKRVIPQHQSYQTQKVGNTNLVRTVTVPEQYQIDLRIDEMETTTNLEKSVYDQLEVGDNVRVRYQKPRLQRSPLVTEVSR